MFQIVLFDDKNFIITYKDCSNEKHVLQILNDWLRLENVKHGYAVKITRYQDE